jgi:hypothetical protein
MAVTELDVKSTDLTAQANQFGMLLKCFVERSYRSGRGKIVNVTKDGLNDANTFNLNSSIWDANDQCKPSFYAFANVGINFHALDSLISYADTLRANKYTSASWSNFAVSLASAKSAKSQDYSATVSAATIMAQAKDTLKAAIDGLVKFTAGITDASNNPKAYALSQNYPNPFNPTTAIQYQIPIASYVNLKVNDMLGREVAVLVNGYQLAGNYTITFDAKNLPSGVYFYRINAGNYSAIKKLVLMK